MYICTDTARDRALCGVPPRDRDNNSKQRTILTCDTDSWKLEEYSEVLL